MTATRRRSLSLYSSLVLVCLALTSTSVASPPVSEEATEDVLRFSLIEAVDIALAVNPQVLSVREKTEEFGQLVSEARANALPEVTAFLSWRKTRDPGLSNSNSPFFNTIDPGDFPPGAFDAFFFSNYVWNIEARQPIYTFGRVSNAMAAAREERGGVNLDVQGLENQIALNTVRAAYAFLLAQNNLRVLETESDARQRQLDQVQVRFELEDATKLDVLRARVALANLQPEILVADNNLQVALASVNTTLGRPIDAPIEVVAELSISEPVPRIMRTEALLELAGQHRPELRRYAVDRKVLDARVGVTKSDLLPQISANAGFGVNTFGASNVSDLALHTWNVGISFDWKLFDGHRVRSQVGVLRSQITQKEHDEHAFRNELSVNLTSANGTWNRSLKALEVTALTVEQAREAERVSEESLKWGAATSLDVLQSTASLRQAELNQTTAAHDALVALAEMKFLVGYRADAPHSVIDMSRAVLGADDADEEDEEGEEP